MKKLLIEEVRTSKTLERAWRAVRRNGRQSKSEVTRNEVMEFEAVAVERLGRIQRQLQSRSFKFAPAIGKKIPKKTKNTFRPLVVAPIESRIVQRAVYDVLAGLPGLQTYIKTPHSFGAVRKGEEDTIAAVPAAVNCVLEAIGRGSLFVVRSDISDFFTKIPKPAVTSMIESVTGKGEFLDLFSAAIKIELSNMAKLCSSDAAKFPIEDIGVAQGNSLSALLGNLYLYNFDLELNKQPDISCIRYIDDFIILAPTKSAAMNQFAKAKSLLESLGLDLSTKKTVPGNAKDGFEFLGIEIGNGYIRPAKEPRERLVASIKAILSESKSALRASLGAQDFDNKFSLLSTLRRVRGSMQGWIKHYWFCNDFNCLAVLSKHVAAMITDYQAFYRDAHKSASEPLRWNLLGIEPLDQIDRTRSFKWPTSG
jgi:RNA-directed DNA polymerase